MDPILKFLNKIAYKFDKGYPDMDSPKDILLIESELKNVGIKLLTENEALANIINKSGLFDDYGDLKTDGKTTIRLIFSDIPSRGANSDNMRKDAYDKLKKLVDKEESLDNYQRLKTGSSLGSVAVDYNGTTYKLVIKGTSSDKFGDTDVKEGLVSLFYQSDIDSPFTKENYEGRINQLIELSNVGITGENDGATKKIIKYLEATAGDAKAPFVNFINQSLSAAIAIKNAYPDAKLIRTGVFDTIRSKAQQLSGLPADKWNPGDLYVQLLSVEGIEEMDNIELINDLFNDEWGEGDKPLTSVSLKQEKAAGGKAKALLQKYTKVKDDYNLTKDEIEFTPDQFREGIDELRKKIQTLTKGNDNMVYDLEDGFVVDEKVRGKYAALKSIEFLFRQFKNKTDEAVVALAGFALSLTGLNPTFFKVTGQRSGESGKVTKFKRGQNIILHNVDGNYEPIKLIDSPNIGGIKLLFKIDKGGEINSILINARNNGNTQGTLEIGDISPI